MSTRSPRSGRVRASRPSAPTATDGSLVTTLANGLTVIIREDSSAPVVSAQAWCRTGSVHEGRWLGAGLSHVLEHMLFKGTARRSGPQIEQEVQAAGGYLNAYTSFDRTVYWINVPNTGTSVAVDILSDILQHASLPAEELAKEMQVIRREMDMNQDDPGRRSSRRLFETAYTESPYRYTIIGYPDIFNELQPKDIRRYYEERYVPNNCFLVIVGAVDSAQVLDQIRAGFGGGKARALPSIVLPVEPRQTAPRELIEEGSTELAHLHISWHIPDLRHPDVPALDVIALLLGSGRSSRLYQEVREKRQLVHSIEAWTYCPGNPGLIGMSAVLEAKHLTDARDAMLQEVRRLRDRPVSAAELRKAVKQCVAATLSTRRTMQGQAQDLGNNWIAAGDLSFSERFLAAVRQTTPAALRRVARLYLSDNNRTAYALVPTGQAPKVARPRSLNRDRPVVWKQLDNGLRLLLKEDRRLPFVEFRAVFTGGVLTESPADNGLAYLTVKCLPKGTRTRSAARIAKLIESVGGALESFAGNNSLGVTAEVLQEDLPLGVDLLAEVLRQPSFPAAEMDRERAVQLASLRAQRDQLLQSTYRLMRRRMYGDAGYGLDTLGNEESVRALRVDQLRRFHHDRISPANGVLAIFGAIDPDRAEAAVRERLGSWRGGAALPDLTAPDPQPGRVEETRDKQQAVLVIGFPGLTVAHPDRYALELIQEACSDLGSRLFLRIRDELGLAYYVGAQNFAGLAPGIFSFYAGTDPAHAARVEQELLREAALLRENGLAEDELQRAKAKMIGQRKIARQDLGAMALTSALDELYGLGYAHSDQEDARYEAVTRDQIRTVARHFLRAESAVVARVGPQP